MRTAPGLVASLLAASTAFAVAPPTGMGRPNRVARAPASQAGVNNGASSFTSPVLTLAAGANRVSFEYAVETQPSGDYLELYWVNSSAVESLLWRESGLKSGSVDLALPSVAGTGRLRFYYRKNASLHRHLDTAWVDDVVVRAANGVLTRFTFDEGTTGWITGSSGFGGAWSSQRELRPMVASRAPAQSGVAGTSGIERSVIFPTNTDNAISFDYFVDGHDADRLNVYFDPATNPVPVFSVSGANKVGRAHVNRVNGAPLPGGPHVVRFEYAKTTSGSGLDAARIDDLKLQSNGVVFEHHRFDGRNPGVAPIAVGTNPAEWTGLGLGGGWVAQPELPHRSQVPAQKSGSAFLPGWSPFTPPTLDGVIANGEYKTATSLRVSTPGSAAPATVWLTAGGATLYLAMRVRGGTAGAGGESGTLTLWLDARHTRALGSRGCGTGKQLPDSDDRKLTISYSIASGASTASVTTGAQLKGSCGSWLALGSSASWPVTAAASEPTNDLGFVHLEVAIVLPAAVGTEEQLGLAFVRTNTSGTASTERFPYRDAAGLVADDDVLSWETVRLDYDFSAQPYTEAPFDGCCFPAPDRPGVRW